MRGLRKRVYGLMLVLAIAPGGILLIYSQTYIQCGIGATDFWWTYNTFGRAVLNVSSENQIATKTIYCKGLEIHSFNSSNNEVSIEVFSQLNGTILNHSLVSGEEIEGIVFPVDRPTGWVQDQNYTILVLWEGTNTSVVFDYYTMSIMHADGTVCWTLPEYYETQNLGFTVLGIGIAIAILFFIVVVMKRNGSG